MKLNVEDRLDILELPARYADALDTLQPDHLRDVFTDDAIWEMIGGLRLEGLEEIMAFMGKPDVHPGAHLMTNIYIASATEDPDGGGPVVHLASRGVYPIGPSDRHNPSAVFYGRYDDDVVQTTAGWRIAHRRYQHGV